VLQRQNVKILHSRARLVQTKNEMMEVPPIHGVCSHFACTKRASKQAEQVCLGTTVDLQKNDPVVPVKREQLYAVILPQHAKQQDK